jgi:2-dehydropantoate 2-reductase
LAGYDVTLIEQWPEHVNAMRTRGIRIEMPEKVLEVPVRAFNVCDVATFTERFDVVLVLVKAYDTRWACQLIEPHLAPGALVVGVQNGMTTDVIADVVGPERTMGAVIEISSTMYDPGIVERHSGPSRSWFAVGRIDPAVEGREAEIAELLRHSGAVEVVEDIRASKWMKLVSNCTTLVTTAILNLPMLRAVEIPGMRDLMLRSGQEALDAGRALGYQTLPIFGLTATDVAQQDHLVELLLDTLLTGFVLPNTTTTILQDWTKGRRSEVDDLNGLIVASEERTGLMAQVNRAVVEVAHRIERHELKPSAGNIELLHELAEE